MSQPEDDENVSFDIVNDIMDEVISKVLLTQEAQRIEVVKNASSGVGNIMTMVPDEPLS